jgi:hypothetical protein
MVALRPKEKQPVILFSEKMDVSPSKKLVIVDDYDDDWELLQLPRVALKDKEAVATFAETIDMSPPNKPVLVLPRKDDDDNGESL